MDECKPLCSGTRSTMGLGARPWEVQCTAETHGPKPCEEFDAAAAGAYTRPFFSST